MSKQENINNVVYYLNHRKTAFQVNESAIDFEELLKEILILYPGLLFYIQGYSYSYRKTQSSVTDYKVTMEYNQDLPQSLNSIIIDNGFYTLHNYKSFKAPDKLYIITDDPENLANRLKKSFHHFHIRYEGLYKFQNNNITFKELTTKSAVIVNFIYCLPYNQLNQKIKQAKSKANNIAKYLTKGMMIPDTVKIFLALSYLQQTTKYNHRASQNIELGRKAFLEDVTSYFSYGPLIENKGICSGIAFAFKALMEAFHIECMIINGNPRDNPNIGHAWNLVKLNNQYYHVDVTHGIEDGVCVRSFMKSDSQMKNYYWDRRYFPKADGKLDYDLIRSWLNINGRKLMNVGVDKKYLFPNVIE